MSDNTSGVPPRATNGIEDPLEEFGEERSSNRIDDALEEFAAETPVKAEPEFARASADAPAPAPLMASTPTIAAAPPVDSATAGDESPKEFELRAPPQLGELVVDAPLFDRREILLEHHERQRRRWIPVIAGAAVIVALPALWWSVSPRSSGPVAEKHETARQVESARPKTQIESAAAKKVAAAPPADVATSSTTDGSAKPHRSASKDASAGTVGVPANEAAAGPVTVGFSPSFAPTVPGMFYHSGTGPASAIMRAETDDSGTIVRVSSVVHDRSSNFHARPSPDGKWLAFDSDRDGERGIYVADANGQGIRRVSGPGFASVPSWSPDGRRLAFVRAEARRPRVWNIWILDLATGHSQRITSHPVGQPWGAAWFPDGKRIAYSHENRLIVRTIDGDDVRIFTSPIRGRLLRTPAVSPDGTQIIFQVHRDGAWMLDVPSGSMSPVLKDPSAEEFTWSPDGKRVAYHSRRSGTWSVWVMAARG